MIEGHGNDWYKYETQLKKDFSSNVWYEGPPHDLLQHLQEKLFTIANYPDPKAANLCRQIEAFYALKPQSSLVGNGSVEVFYLLAKLFANQSSTIIIPAFAEYEDACTQFNHSVKYLRHKELSANALFESAMVWLGNPNNPDGKITPLSWIKQWLTNNPNTVFVVDEAYADFCIDFTSASQLLGSFPNLVLVKSFTKAFAIPGLRLGLMLGSSELILQLHEHLQPWSVNSLAQAAGEFIVANHKRLMFNKMHMQQLSQNMQKQLGTHAMLELYPSPTNYFLVKTLKGDAQKLKDYLMDEHGYLIRNASNFKGLTPQHFRIAIQDEESNDRLVKAIFQWLG